MKSIVSESALIECAETFNWTNDTANEGKKAGETTSSLRKQGRKLYSRWTQF